MGFDVVTGDDSMGTSSGDRDVDGEDEEDEEGELTRFLTYEEPDDDLPVDIDVYATSQFVNKHCEIDREADGRVFTKTSDMMSAITEWGKINNVEFDELSIETADNMRSGALSRILNKRFSIEKTRADIGDAKPRVYQPIKLSDSIRELIE